MRARRAAERAIRLNEYDEYSHWLLGLHQLADRNFEMAVAELERAIEINPNCSLAYGSLATVLNFAGQAEEAITNNLIAVRSNPLEIRAFSTGIQDSRCRTSSWATMMLLIGWARKSVLFKPDWFQGHVVLIVALVESGQPTWSLRQPLATILRAFPEASCDDVFGIAVQRPRTRTAIGQVFEEGGFANITLKTSRDCRRRPETFEATKFAETALCLRA